MDTEVGASPPWLQKTPVAHPQPKVWPTNGEQQLFLGYLFSDHIC
jgi:hypothetical protein